MLESMYRNLQVATATNTFFEEKRGIFVTPHSYFSKELIQELTNIVQETLQTMKTAEANYGQRKYSNLGDSDSSESVVFSNPESDDDSDCC